MKTPERLVLDGGQIRVYRGERLVEIRSRPGALSAIAARAAEAPHTPSLAEQEQLRQDAAATGDATAAELAAGRGRVRRRAATAAGKARRRGSKARPGA